MLGLPPMSRREKAGTATILLVGLALLGLAFWRGWMSLLQIAALIGIGIGFVGGTLYLYRQLWDEED